MVSVMARPTEYSKDVVNDATAYLECFNVEQSEREGLTNQEVIPSIVGLCRYINRARSTVYKWIGEEGKEPFSDIVSAIGETQEIRLLSGGLSGGYNPMITKLILSKHGYAEKTEVDNKSSDGSMSPNTYSQEDYKNAQDNIKKGMEDLD